MKPKCNLKLFEVTFKPEITCKICKQENSIECLLGKFPKTEKAIPINAMRWEND